MLWKFGGIGAKNEVERKERNEKVDDFKLEVNKLNVSPIEGGSIKKILKTSKNTIFCHCNLLNVPLEYDRAANALARLMQTPILFVFLIIFYIY